jgi:Flp pilus assembly protein TadD
MSGTAPRPTLLVLRLVAALAAAAAAAPAAAVMSGTESRTEPSSDGDYAKGKAAFADGRWAEAIAELEKVVARRPWHDNGHAMLGYAHRRLGRRDLAVSHYRAALALNPRHRGALEYLAEMQLDEGRLDEARATLVRLGEVCRFVVMGFDNQGWFTGCEEFEQLRQAFARHGIEVEPIDRSRR